jgi:hypothetical protein
VAVRVAQIAVDVAMGSAICAAKEWLTSVFMQEAALLRTVLEAASGDMWSTVAAAAERRCVPRAVALDT